MENYRVYHIIPIIFPSGYQYHTIGCNYISLYYIVDIYIHLLYIYIFSLDFSSSYPHYFPLSRPTACTAHGYGDALWMVRTLQQRRSAGGRHGISAGRLSPLELERPRMSRAADSTILKNQRRSRGFTPEWGNS